MRSVCSVNTRSSISSAEGTSAPMKPLASLVVRYPLSSSSGSTGFQSGSNLSWVANSNYLSHSGRAKIACRDYAIGRPAFDYDAIQQNGLAAMGLNWRRALVKRTYSGACNGPVTITKKSGYQSAETDLTFRESISLRMV